MILCDEFDAFRCFGPKVISLKPIVKTLPKLLEDRDKTVRDETKMLVIEVYKWIGAALKPQLANLKPVQVGATLTCDDLCLLSIL